MDAIRHILKEELDWREKALRDKIRPLLKKAILDYTLGNQKALSLGTVCYWAIKKFPVAKQIAVSTLMDILSTEPELFKEIINAISISDFMNDTELSFSIPPGKSLQFTIYHAKNIKITGIKNISVLRCEGCGNIEFAGLERLHSGKIIRSDNVKFPHLKKTGDHAEDILLYYSGNLYFPSVVTIDGALSVDSCSNILFNKARKGNFITISNGSNIEFPKIETIESISLRNIKEYNFSSLEYVNRFSFYKSPFNFPSLKEINRVIMYDEKEDTIPKNVHVNFMG